MSLYVWGRVDFHNLVSARAADMMPLEFPTRIPKLPCQGPVTSVAVGDQHCLFIADGQLYGFGSNKQRQLHHLALDVCDAPIQIALPPSATGKPVQVACGAHHSLVLLDDGSVMSAGLNDLEQLGHVKTAKDGKQPAEAEKWRGWDRVALAVQAEKIVASGNASFVLSGGQVYSWGSQRHGHLGHGTTGELERERSGAAQFENVKYPAKIQWFASQKLRIVDIAAGPTHMLARTETDVYGVGDNSYGKLAARDVSCLLTPQRIQIMSASDADERLIGVACGSDQSFAIRTVMISNVATAVVYSWGHIDKDPCTNPTPVAWGVPQDAVGIVGGFDFQLLLRRTGELYSWGFPRPSYGTTTAMLSSDPAKPIQKRFPYPVDCMEGKCVTSAAIGKTFAVLICDDTRFTGATSTRPDNRTLHCMIPKGNRYALGFTPRLTADRFEECIKAFYKKMYGAQAAEAYFAEIPTATPAPVAKGVTLVRRGASNLRVGSKVRVWVQDVYAWGIVIGRDIEGYPPNSFEIRWVREDWDPEVVQLQSDDETLDEANEDRWQHLWVASEGDTH